MAQEIKEFNSLVDLLEECQKQNMTSAEIASFVEHYLEYKAREKCVPLHVNFELTPMCNLDCKMCLVHLNQEQYKQQNCSLLSGAQWKNIIQQAVDMGMLGATLTGGEALLHPDFDEIFLFLIKNNIRVNLKTNGVLLTKEKLAFLLENHLSSIQISIYGSDDDSYEQVTGKRVFSQVLAAIERVRNSGISYEIVITPSKYMWNNIKELIRYVESLGVTYTINPCLADPLPETGRSGYDHDLSIEQYIDLYKFRLELNGKAIKPNCIDDIPPTGGNISENVYGIRCAAGKSTFSVTWRGIIQPCLLMNKIGFNGLDISLAEGWKRINASVKAYPIPRECVNCEFEGICIPCVVQHSLGAESGHANPMICKQAKRMAEEGFYVLESKKTGGK